MYSIVYTKQAAKTLLKMPRNLILLMREKLEQIARDPHAHHANVNKFQNHPGYRLRVEDWRIIYKIENDQLVVLVLKIAPRGEVYR